MSFDPFVAIIAMYGSVLCGSMGVLFWAFKGTFNPSGRFFLFSEALRIPALISLGAFHLDPISNFFAIFVVSPVYMLSEVSFIYSLSALARNDSPKHFGKVLSAVLLLCVVVEAIRSVSAHLHLSMYLIMLSGASTSAIWICANTKDQGLRNAPFWRILKYVEFLFLVISITRFVLLILGITITPTEGGSPNIILVSMMLTLLIFRSFCYQSIWMTWTSPHAKENRLNKNLLKTFQERDLLFQQLAASNRRIGVSALASSLAHQLSQPLTGAALQAEAVKQRLSHQTHESDALQGLQKITDILGHLSGIVRNLRSLFAAHEEKLEPIAFEPLCHEIIKLAEYSQKASGITLQTCGHIHSPIFGNPIQLQQVIINLIDNAIHASKEALNKKIEIEFAEQADTISLCIRDHGPGFSAEVLDDLFSLYQTTRDNGTGIGLWLSREIIEKHKGKISAFNHADGGACVLIELPIAGDPR